MARYAGLLRAVNVAGNTLSMADLVRVVETAGGRDVRTYLQSGNVVFTGAASLAGRIERSLADDVGVVAKVLLRSHADLAAVVAAKPFDAAGTAVSVTFLSAVPRPAQVSAIDPTAYGVDAFRVVGREVFVHTPEGYGRSKLTNAFFERKLGVDATTRNWNTVLALADLTA